MDSFYVSQNLPVNRQYYQFNEGAPIAFCGVIITTLGILLQAYTDIGTTGALAMNAGGLAITIIGLTVIAVKKNLQQKKVVEKTLPKEQKKPKISTSSLPTPSVNKEKFEETVTKEQERPEISVPSLPTTPVKEKMTKEKFEKLMQQFGTCSKDKEEETLDEIKEALKADRTLLPTNSSFDKTPLSSLSTNSKKVFKFAQMLAELDINPNDFRNGSSFLHIMAEDDLCYEAVEGLLTLTTDASFVNRYGMIPLSWACITNASNEISAPKNIQAFLNHAKKNNYSIHVREPLSPGMNKGLTPFLRACQGAFFRFKIESQPTPEFTEIEKALLPQLMEGIVDLRSELDRLKILNNDRQNAKVEAFETALLALKS